jgi:signal transduction histidine kinase
VKDTWTDVEEKARSARRWIPVIFAVIISSFLAATAVVHAAMRKADQAAHEITSNTAPSIERLADARAELRRLQTLLDEARHAELAPMTEIEESRRALDRLVDGYLALPVQPDERELHGRVDVARRELNAALVTFTDAARRGDAATTTEALHTRLPAAIAALYDDLTQTIRSNASHTLAFAAQIQGFRQRAAILATVLDVGCVILALAGAIWIRRLHRAHVELLEQHRALTAEKASELEGFAGRVAHDILSPLNVVGFALDLAGKEADADRRQRVLTRGVGALQRIQTLVSGLLDFARAGGRPDTDAKADLDGTIREVVHTLEPAAAKAGAELSVSSDTKEVVVACNPGVLMSLLSNLATNALKYIGDGPERAVEIRARDRGETVRVEVADTGPGVPPSVASHVFEPYVRAAGTKQSGIGLGLATVKRLAEAHGGRVGLDSTPGHGATFWFELPKAT